MDTTAGAKHATICTTTGQKNTGVVTLLLMLATIAIIQTVKFKLIIATTAHWTILLFVHGYAKNAITRIEGISAQSAFKPTAGRYILT